MEQQLQKFVVLVYLHHINSNSAQDVLNGKSMLEQKYLLLSAIWFGFCEYAFINLWLLWQIDMTMVYGPRMGMMRMERWERARKLGPKPQQEIDSWIKTSSTILSWNLSKEHVLDQSMDRWSPLMRTCSMGPLSSSAFVIKMRLWLAS